MEYKLAFCYKKKNFFSKLIADITASRWSHVFLIVDSLEDDYLVVESTALGGVRFNLLSKFKNGYVVEIYDVKADHYSLKSLTPYIGDGYGYGQILGNLFAKLLRLKKNPVTSDTVCSELMLIWLRSTNLAPLFSKLDANLASPEDLYRITRAHEEFTYSELNSFYNAV